MIDLKPCPFCGGEAEYFDERIIIFNNAFLMGIKCAQCGGAILDNDKSHCPNDVFRAWNRRLAEAGNGK